MARQLYYTSAAAGRTGRAGFQFVATSPSVTPDLERLIEPFMTYRPPPGPHAPDDCPVSLAYDVTPHGAVFVCCRYLGADYSGREGNFFGHAIVASVEELDGVRPIELWRAPGWSSLPGGGADPLPELVRVEPGESLDPDSVAAFLTRAGVPAYRLLTILLDAVRATLAGQAGPVRLVCDDVEATCHWIAAVSYSLPFDTVTGLSFVTYTAEPTAARHHLVGTTTTAWAGVSGDQAAFRLDTLRPPETAGPPSRYATAVTHCWRRRDLAGIDLLCEVAALGDRSDPDLDAAAALLALCAGQPVDAAEQAAVGRLLRAAPASNRVTLLDRVVTALTRVPARDGLDALLDGELTDLLVDRDWAAAPQLGRRVLTAYGRRHQARRAEVTERLAALRGAGLLSQGGLAESVGQLWAGQNPTVPEMVQALESLDPATAGQPVLRDLAGAALRDADPTTPETVRLAQLMERSTPARADRPRPRRPGPPPTTATEPGSGPPPPLAPSASRPGAPRSGEPSPGTAPPQGASPSADGEEATGNARLVLGLHRLSETYAPDLVVESLTELGRVLPTGAAGLADRVLAAACALLAARPVPHRVAVLVGLDETMRTLITERWLQTGTTDEAGETDLAEIAARLHGAGACPAVLGGHVRSLVRRPLAQRRLARVLAARDRDLVPLLRDLVRERQRWRSLLGGEG